MISMSGVEVINKIVKSRNMSDLLSYIESDEINKELDVRGSWIIQYIIKDFMNNFSYNDNEDGSKEQDTYENIEAVRIILTHPKTRLLVNFNEFNEHFMDILSGKDEKWLLLFFDFGLDINLKYSDGHTLLTLAIKKGNKDLVKSLVYLGCDVGNALNHIDARISDFFNEIKLSDTEFSLEMFERSLARLYREKFIILEIMKENKISEYYGGYPLSLVRGDD